MKLPAEVHPDELTAEVDTREQTPLDLSPLRCETSTLDTGDYSLKGLESIVRVERKSLPDLLACCGTERERFERELRRLVAYPSRLLVIEATWDQLQSGGWSRSQLTPASVTGSLLGWQAMGIPVLLVGDHEAAGRAVSRFLFIVGRRYWRIARGLLEAVPESAEAAEAAA